MGLDLASQRHLFHLEQLDILFMIRVKWYDNDDDSNNLGGWTPQPEGAQGSPLIFI